MMYVIGINDRRWLKIFCNYILYIYIWICLIFNIDNFKGSYYYFSSMIPLNQEFNLKQIFTFTQSLFDYSK